MEKRKLLDSDHSAMAELTRELIRASRVYYGSGGQEIMSDDAFDEKKIQLQCLENIEGYYYEGSVNYTVGAEVSSDLPSVRHEYPALSLDKFKYRDIKDLEKWLAEKEGVVSIKCDGLTLVATYNDSELDSVDMVARYKRTGDTALIGNADKVVRLSLLATRGNGETGSDISRNADIFSGLPKTIPAKGKHIFRGEGLMSYKEFARINENADGDYNTPRNLGSATARLLNPEDGKDRKMQFMLFEMVYPTADDEEYNKTVKGFDLRYQSERFRYCSSLGFTVVPFMKTKGNLIEVVEKFHRFVEKWDYPSDGLVITYNDKVYADALGNTQHGPRGSRALKWNDEGVETVIREIENSAGPKGKITPVAIFDPVVLGQGSTVTRASLHNLAVIDSMPDIQDDSKTVHVGVGSRVKVVLAQAIIPQIVAASEGEYIPPEFCPVCREKLQLNEKSKILYCTNPRCGAKTRGRLGIFFSKDGCEAKGLGPSQIDDICDSGIISEEHPLEFYKLREKYPTLPEALNIDGWGEKAWSNLLDAIDESRSTTFNRFLYAMGIKLVGHDLSKKLNTLFNGDFDEVVKLITSDDLERDRFFNKLLTQDGIGLVKAGAFMGWINDLNRDKERRGKFIELYNEHTFNESAAVKTNDALNGLTFVITGDVNIFENRDHFKQYCEDNGAKVSGSVSSKTNYLVINDLSSQTSKAVKARSLGIELLSEQAFVDKFGYAEKR